MVIKDLLTYLLTTTFHGKTKLASSMKSHHAYDMIQYCAQHTNNQKQQVFKQIFYAEIKRHFRSSLKSWETESTSDYQYQHQIQTQCQSDDDAVHSVPISKSVTLLSVKLDKHHLTPSTSVSTALVIYGS